MTSTASIESLLEGIGLEDTPTYGDYVRGMLDDVDDASLNAQIDEVVAYLAEVLDAPAASLCDFASALREVWTNPQAASAVAEAAALADDAAPPPADEGSTSDAPEATAANTHPATSVFINNERVAQTSGGEVLPPADIADRAFHARVVSALRTYSTGTLCRGFFAWICFTRIVTACL